MQTPESVPNSIQRTVRSEHTSPTGLEDLLPGSTLGDTLPGSTLSIASIRSELDDAENVAADIELHTRQFIREQVAEAARDVESIQANLQGYIGNELDASAKVADKLAGKVAARINNGLTQAYADTVRLGFPVPTIEQVQYGIATGDYLGSMVSGTDIGQSAVQKGKPVVVIETPVKPPSLRPPLPPVFPPPPPPQDQSDCGITLPNPPPTAIVTKDFTPEHPDCVNFNPGKFSWCPSLPFPPTYYDGRYEILADGTEVITAWERVVPEPPAGKYDGYHYRCNDQYFRSFYVPAGWFVRQLSGGLVVALSKDIPCGRTISGIGVCANHISPTVTTGVVIDANIVLPPVEPTPTTQEICPVDVFSCGEPAKFPGPQAEIAKSDDYCNDLDGFIQSLPGDADIANTITAAFNSLTDSTIAKQVAKALTGSDKPVVASMIISLGKWLSAAQREAINRSTCDKTRLMPIATIHGILKFINQWFGVVPRATTQTLQQAENTVCQTVMPDQPSTDKAYLANQIPKELWECWTRLNGSVVKAAEVGLETLRTRPTSEQVSKLYRRDMIDEAEFIERMRGNGVIHGKDVRAIHDLTQDWPSLSDLTPMLVRDVWDETTIDWTEVDRLFESKYTKETKKYFDAIGLTKDVVKYYWRAHFHLPSFTMASEMYHRFRALPEGDPLRTDLEKVKALLIQDDWHPDWIDRMLAITFRPMRLVDIRTAYDMRILDAEGLRDKLRVLGYSDDDVATTERIWERRRDIRDAKQGGFPSIKTLISQYANCEIDDHTFRYIVSFIVETPEQELKAVEAAQIARQSEDYRRTIAGVSWQYRRGLISEAEATAALSQQGIDPSCVPSLVRTWKSQAAKQPKQLAAGSLCKMLEQGVINQSEFVNALIRIGYTSIDADRIMRSCAVGLTQKEMRRANQEAARLAREQRAIEREAAKRQRLAECGPPACPKTRQTPSKNGEVGP